MAHRDLRTNSDSPPFNLGALFFFFLLHFQNWLFFPSNLALTLKKLLLMFRLTLLLPVMLSLRYDACMANSHVLQLQPFSSHLVSSVHLFKFCFFIIIIIIIIIIITDHRQICSLSTSNSTRTHLSLMRSYEDLTVGIRVWCFYRDKQICKQGRVEFSRKKKCFGTQTTANGCVNLTVVALLGGRIISNFKSGNTFIDVYDALRSNFSELL